MLETAMEGGQALWEVSQAQAADLAVEHVIEPARGPVAETAAGLARDAVGAVVDAVAALF